MIWGQLQQPVHKYTLEYLNIGVIKTKVQRIIFVSVVISNTGAANGIVTIRPMALVDIKVLRGPSVRARFLDITNEKLKNIEDPMP